MAWVNLTINVYCSKVENKESKGEIMVRQLNENMIHLATGSGLCLWFELYGDRKPSQALDSNAAFVDFRSSCAEFSLRLIILSRFIICGPTVTWKIIFQSNPHWNYPLLPTYVWKWYICHKRSLTHAHLKNDTSNTLISVCKVTKAALRCIVTWGGSFQVNL